jgi:hypothetical protein
MGYCGAVIAHVRCTVLAAVSVKLGVSILAFALLQLLPGDPALVMLGDSGAPPERIAELRVQLGLDDPLLVQYARFLGNLLRGGLGRSICSNRLVFEEIASRRPTPSHSPSRASAWPSSSASRAQEMGPRVGDVAVKRHPVAQSERLHQRPATLHVLRLSVSDGLQASRRELVLEPSEGSNRHVLPLRGLDPTHQQEREEARVPWLGLRTLVEGREVGREGHPVNGGAPFTAGHGKQLTVGIARAQIDNPMDEVQENGRALLEAS